jgi:hypothetical protein
MGMGSVEVRGGKMNGLARFLYGVTHRDVSMHSQLPKKNVIFPSQGGYNTLQRPSPIHHRLSYP